MLPNCAVQQAYWICIVWHIISAAALLEGKQRTKNRSIRKHFHMVRGYEPPAAHVRELNRQHNSSSDGLIDVGVRLLRWEKHWYICSRTTTTIYSISSESHLSHDVFVYMMSSSGCQPRGRAPPRGHRINGGVVRGLMRRSILHYSNMRLWV